MTGVIRTAACTLALVALIDSQASPIYRCTSETGKVTFSQLGCLETQQMERQQAHNPTPGKGRPVPLAGPGRAEAERSIPELVVVGAMDDGCGNVVSGKARRQAIIRKDIQPGMTRADVESALGKPNETSGNNGLLRYHYADRQGRTRTVTFDAAGCVTGKRRH